MKPSERMWRTLMRVDSQRMGGVMFIIPGWDHRTPVFVPWENIDKKYHQACTNVGFRLHCHCNIGAEDARELCFERWED